jgi:hypothetical protein
VSISFNQKVQNFADQLADNDFDFEDAALTFARLDHEMEAAGDTTSKLARDQMETLRYMFSTAHLSDPISMEPIQPPNFITAGGNFFDVNELMKGVLSQSAPINPMNRQPLTEDELTRLCAHFNIHVDNFQSLWPLAEAELREHTDSVLKALDNDDAREQYLLSSSIDEDNANYKREARLRLFDQLTSFEQPLAPIMEHKVETVVDQIPILIDARPANNFCNLFTRVAVAALVAITGVALTFLR